MPIWEWLTTWAGDWCSNRYGSHEGNKGHKKPHPDDDGSDVGAIIVLNVKVKEQRPRETSLD